MKNKTKACLGIRSGNLFCYLSPKKIKMILQTLHDGVFFRFLKYSNRFFYGRFKKLEDWKGKFLRTLRLAKKICERKKCGENNFQNVQISEV